MYIWCWSTVVAEGEVQYDPPKLLHHKRKNSRLTPIINKQKFLVACDETHLTNSGTIFIPRSQINRMSPRLKRNKVFIEYEDVKECLRKLFVNGAWEICLHTNLGTGMKRNHAFILIEGNNNVFSCLLLVNKFASTILPSCVSDADKGIKKDSHCTMLIIGNDQ